MVIHLLARVSFGLGPLQENTMCALAGYLVAIPIIVYFTSTVSPAKADLPFIMIRPVTNGELMMAAFKATAISAVLSWVIVLAAFCVMPWLGDFHAVEKNIAIPPPYRTITALGLIFLTWRFIAVNLCFAWSGKKRLTDMPALMFALVCFGACSLLVLGQNSGFWDSVSRIVPSLLAGLLVVKFLLAFFSFRVSLQRRLLAPSSVAGYLFIWILVVAILIAALVIPVRPPKDLLLQASMAIILLVPLARIGFCPITLSWNRHN
jgi:hypothetical protein